MTLGFASFGIAIEYKKPEFRMPTGSGGIIGWPSGNSKSSDRFLMRMVSYPIRTYRTPRLSSRTDPI